MQVLKVRITRMLGSRQNRSEPVTNTLMIVYSNFFFNAAYKYGCIRNNILSKQPAVLLITTSG